MQKVDKEHSHLTIYNAVLATVVTILLAYQINQSSNVFSVVTSKIDKQDEKIANVNEKINGLQQDVAVIKAFYMADKSCEDKKPISSGTTVELSGLAAERLTTKKFK
ncbi:MAG: hypothetical protein JST04_00685 [Bdellovibrionales bacterium]|nr:hypothetical protein [Bdellovibrionales bacterium]